MTDWQHTDAPAPLDNLVVDDLDLVDEVTHPIRGPIFRRLKTPRSAAELADSMDVPVTRLYHHINRLEAAGLIQVVATRRVGAVTERRYQVVARRLRLDEDDIAALDPRELARAAGTLFDSAKLGMLRALETGRVLGPADGNHGILSFNEVTLPAGKLPALMARVAELVAAIDDADDPDTPDDDPDAERAVVFVSAYPVVD